MATNGAEEQASLPTLLPQPAQRTALALLLLLTTDAQKLTLQQTFSAPHAPSAPLRTGPGEVDVTITEAAYLAHPTPENEAKLTPYQAQSLLTRRREWESMMVRGDMAGLKRGVETHFENWRAKVLRRVCDVLGVRAEEVKRARREWGARTRESGSGQDGFRNWAMGLQGDDGEEEGEKEDGEYERIETSLVKLPKETRVQVLNCCFMLLLSLEEYSALSRVLLVRLAINLNVPRTTLAAQETKLAESLLRAADHISATSHAQAESAANATSRRWRVGLAAVAGATLIGVTGGLAAPLVAAGIGSVFGAVGLGAVTGLLGALAGNAVLIGGLFGAYGAKMTGGLVKELSADVEDFAFIPLLPKIMGSEQEREAYMKLNHKLRVTIGVPGFLTTTKEISHPARIVKGSGTEVFALRWEVESLLRIGLAFSTVLKSYIWDVAKYELLKRTVLAAAAASLWPIGLVRMARVLDNPFNVGRIRADKAGKVLARALIAGCAGSRPVSLVGISLGGRVIFACLKELAAQNAWGIVENVVLLGAPVSREIEDWVRIRSVVSGRLVNVWSDQDLLLAFMYRASTAEIDVAGLGPIDGVRGVENIDVSDLVDGHSKYRYVTGRILMRIGWEDISRENVDREARELMALEEADEKLKDLKKDEDNDREIKAVETSVRKRLERELSERPPVRQGPSRSTENYLIDLDRPHNEAPPSYSAATTTSLPQRPRQQSATTYTPREPTQQAVPEPRPPQYQSDPLDVVQINNAVEPDELHQQDTDDHGDDGYEGDEDVIISEDLAYLDPDPVIEDEDEDQV